MSCDIGDTMITKYNTFKNTSFKTVCTKKVCTCENGSGATGIFCWEHLKKGCFHCEPGFYKTLRDHSQIKSTKDISKTSVSPPIYSCEQIECTCLNGIAKIGRNCYKHGKLSCEKCDENYKLVEVSPFIFECSKEVECSCFSGDVLENSLCTNAEPEKCSSCKPFYHLNETNLKCEINRCSCENGYPLYQCKVNFDQNCLFCDAGHHLENTDISNVKHCSKNMCSCKNGYSPNSTNLKPCPNHESEFCAECFQSHQNFAGNCVEKTCVCLNGHPSQKQNCPETGAHHCSSCNNHYELGKNIAKCYPKVYSSCSPSPCENSGVCRVLSPEYVECDCKNGFTGPFCDKVNHCFKSAPCLNDGICKLDYSTDRGYICGCSEGFVGYNCETDLSEPCACPNGVPKRPCSGYLGIIKEVQCESCINGFEILNGICVESECVCDHGKAVVGFDSITGKFCKNTGVEMCELPCELGFELNFVNGIEICENIDECEKADFESVCHHGICIDTIGSFECNCFHGYFGNFCVEKLPIDNCLSNNFLISEMFDYVCIQQSATASLATVDVNRIPFDQSIGYASGVKNVCFCESGTEDTFCENNGSEKCRSCDFGYHLDKKVVFGNEEIFMDVWKRFDEIELDRANVFKTNLIKTIRTLNIDTQNYPKCLENNCECLHGNGTKTLNCENHGSYICETCDPGYHLLNNICESNICNCQNGINATHTKCGIHGADVCSTCEPGYHLNRTTDHILFESVYCDLNKCVCDQGTPTNGTSCPFDGNINCSNCVKGYYNSNNQSCEENVCTCEKGEHAVNADCPGNGDEFCLECDSGFYKTEKNDCSENVCSCENGDPTRNEACPKHATEFCDSCDFGHHLMTNNTTVGGLMTSGSFYVGVLVSEASVTENVDTMQCLENECSCSDGTPVQNSDCAKHESVQCEVCDSFFHLDENTNLCEQNICSCPNGEAATGTECTTNGETKCKSCSNGNFLSNFLCSQTTCTCANGVGATGINCIINGDQKCISCNTGFQISDSSECEADECTCTHGTPATGTACSPNGSHKCASCQTGFHLASNAICSINQCTCSNGSGEYGTSCAVHGALGTCVSCNNGYDRFMI